MEKMLEHKTKRVEEEKKEEKNKKGRKKKDLSKDKVAQILEEVDKELDNYVKTIDLNENDFIPYSLDEITNLPNQNSKQLSRMIQIYIQKLNDDEKNDTFKVYNFSKNLKNIISFLSMSENEFSVFTILLDRIGLANRKQYNVFEHLYYIGILAMQISSDKYINNIDNKFTEWKKDIRIDENMIKINIKEMNNKREELTLSDEEFDPEKYIDYNQLVDDILNETHFYKENKE
jgi:hypothetical protein